MSTPETTSEPLITIDDLINIRIFMQLMAQRGVIKAEEMTPFGRIFNNLNNFLLHKVPNAPSMNNPESLKSPAETPKSESDKVEQSEPSNYITI